MSVFCRPAQWLALVLTLAASPALGAAGPPPGFTLSDNTDLALTSPDRATKIAQYKRETDSEFKWQVWARRGDQMTELKPEQDYPAGFRFTDDSQWLVRMQKTGSGEQDLFLYHFENGTLVNATRSRSAILPGPIFIAGPTRRT